MKILILFSGKKFAPYPLPGDPLQPLRRPPPVVGVAAVSPRVEQLLDPLPQPPAGLLVDALHLRVDDASVHPRRGHVVRLRQDVPRRQGGVQHLVQEEPHEAEGAVGAGGLKKMQHVKANEVVIMPK